MDHPDDLERESRGHETDPLFASLRRRRSKRSRAPLVAGIVVLVAIAAGGLWYWTKHHHAAPEAPASSVFERSDTTDSARARSAALDTAGIGALPPLDSSDVLVRDLAEDVSPRPGVSAWFKTDDLVRRFVLAVTNVAKGTKLTSRLGFLAPTGSFSVREVGGRMFIDSTSYHRYDAVTDAFTSLDTQPVARLYRRIRPLCERAYDDLGLSDGSFEDALSEAFGRLLAVEAPRGAIEVTAQGAVYQFADPNLEGLPPASKHLIRMGPANADRIQAKLRELAVAMGVQPTVR